MRSMMGKCKSPFCYSKRITKTSSSFFKDLKNLAADKIDIDAYSVWAFVSLTSGTTLS